jgi:membrane protein implicated in regulation of membrane protease activity
MLLAKLNDVTAKSMIWLAIIILFVGMMIASPAGRFFSTIVAMMVALVPLLFNRSKKRIIAGVIVAAAAFFAYATFGEFKKDQDRYKERARQASSRLHPVQHGGHTPYCCGIAQRSNSQDVA